MHRKQMKKKKNLFAEGEVRSILLSSEMDFNLPTGSDMAFINIPLTLGNLSHVACIQTRQ